VLHRHADAVRNAISYLSAQRLLTPSLELSADAMFLVTLPVALQLALLIKRVHDGQA
jgi:hypothetical protein